MTAISTLLELQKQGQNITVEEFLHSRDDKTLEDSVKKLSDELHFVKRDIRDIPAEEAQRLLADCFTNKQPLFQCTPPLTGNDVMHLLQQNWAMFLDHSFGVVDENGKLRGVALACDGSEPDLKLQGVHPHLGAIVQYLHVISAQAAPQFIADPHIPGTLREYSNFTPFAVGPYALGMSMRSLYMPRLKPRLLSMSNLSIRFGR